MVANRIAELRTAQGLTLEDVAAHLTERLGLEQPMAAVTVSRYERGKRAVPDSVKLALSELFCVDVAWLMGWTDDAGRLRPVEALTA